MLNSYQFDITSVAKTWLQDTKHQHDYVQVELEKSKKSNWKKRQRCRFLFKRSVRTDLTLNHTDLEILLVKIRGRNSNTPTLVCAVYQPSSIEIEKLEWLEKMEQFPGMGF